MAATPATALPSSGATSTTSSTASSMSARAAIAELDGQPGAEIVHPSEAGVYVFHDDGSTYWYTTTLQVASLLFRAGDGQSRRRSRTGDRDQPEQRSGRLRARRHGGVAVDECGRDGHARAGRPHRRRDAGHSVPHIQPRPTSICTTTTSAARRWCGPGHSPRRCRSTVRPPWPTSTATYPAAIPARRSPSRRTACCTCSTAKTAAPSGRSRSIPAMPAASRSPIWTATAKSRSWPARINQRHGAHLCRQRRWFDLVERARAGQLAAECVGHGSQRRRRVRSGFQRSRSRPDALRRSQRRRALQRTQPGVSSRKRAPTIRSSPMSTTTAYGEMVVASQDGLARLWL